MPRRGSGHAESLLGARPQAHLQTACPVRVRGGRFGPLGAVPLGAVPLGTGLVEFRVWAPDAVDEKRRILRVRRGGVELAVDFERLTAEVVP